MMSFLSGPQMVAADGGISSKSVKHLKQYQNDLVAPPISFTPTSKDVESVGPFCSNN